MDVGGAADDATVDEELGGRKRGLRLLQLGPGCAGDVRMVTRAGPRAPPLGTVARARSRKRARVSSPRCCCDRRRQLQHHDRPRAGRAHRRTRRAATPRRADVRRDQLLLEGLLGLDGLRLRDADGVVLVRSCPGIGRRSRRRGWLTDSRSSRRRSGNVPIAIRVDRPSEVGPDRLVNALAAGRLHGRPAIVVDLGTATTFDVVAADGAYVGGAIAPGLELGLEALAARTSTAATSGALLPERAIGRDTVARSQRGRVRVLGLVASCSRGSVPSSATSRRRPHVSVVLTGGSAWPPGSTELRNVDVDRSRPHAEGARDPRRGLFRPGPDPPTGGRFGAGPDGEGRCRDSGGPRVRGRPCCSGSPVDRRVQGGGPAAAADRGAAPRSRCS